MEFEDSMSGKRQTTEWAYHRDKDITVAYATAWTELESIMLSELSQAARDKYHIAILLTIFSMLYFTSLWLFRDYQSELLNPFTFSPYFLKPFLFWQPSV